MSKVYGEKEIKKLRNINIVSLVLFILNLILGIYLGSTLKSAIWGLGVLVIGIQLVNQQIKFKNRELEKSN